MKMRILFMASALLLLGCKSDSSTGGPVKEEPKEAPKPLAVGYSVGLSSITAEKMGRAKAAGIEYVEAGGMNAFFDADRNFSKEDAEANSMMKAAKKAAPQAKARVKKPSSRKG